MVERQFESSVASLRFFACDITKGVDLPVNPPILPMLAYLESDAFKNSPPQLLIWEFPERYLPVNNEIGDADPQWVAQLKAAGIRQQNLVQNTTKSESPVRAQN